MINQTLPTNINTYKHAHFGARLKSAREALGIDRKEVASQLRLHEQVITMIENGEFSTDLPLTFIRGYIRNYSKLMGLPEKELNDALELLKPQPETTENEQTAATPSATASPAVSTSKKTMPVNIGNFFMQLSTYLLAITLIGLVGIWWHTHKSEVHTNTNGSLSTTQTPVTTVAQASTETTTPAVENNSQNTVDSTATPVAADNTDTALPNAENPDAQTPPTALENTANTIAPDTANPTQATDNANTADTKSDSTPTDNAAPTPSSDQASTTTATKSIFPLSRGDKTPLANIVTGHPAIQWLTHLVLFLIILTASIRMYAQPHSHRMASIRTNTKSHAAFNNINLNNILKLTDKFKINKTMQLITVLAVTVSLMVFSIAWWYEHRTTGTMLADATVSTDVSQAQEQVDLAPITTDLETLAPTLNVNNTLMTNFKSYPLYSMVNQLDAYINQAADTKFNLTDKSTAIGQFIPYKKKYRKHRQQAINNNNNNTNDNAIPQNNYNNAYGNSAPPFYYQQQYGVSGQ